MERVFEINRNFRNEGLSTRHNPEFTMLELYQSYANYKTLMDLTEELLKHLAEKLFETTSFEYQGKQISLAQPLRVLTMAESLVELAGLEARFIFEKDYLAKVLSEKGGEVNTQWGSGKLLMEVFERLVESTLFEPTFITEYPAEVSPLARRNDSNPMFTDRF